MARTGWKSSCGWNILIKRFLKIFFDENDIVCVFATKMPMPMFTLTTLVEEGDVSWPLVSSVAVFPLA